MILFCYGTRPEYLKLEPLMKKMEGVIPFYSLHSGQHKDLLHSDATYKIDIVDGKNRLDSVVSSLMNCVNFK